MSFQQFLQQLDHAFLADDPDATQKSAEAANVKRLQEMYQAIARGDYDALGGFYADDVVMEIMGPPELPISGRVQGRQAATEAVRRNFGFFEDQRPTILDVVAQGDAVVVTGREQGKYRPTGRDYDIHWVQLFTFDRGKLRQFREIVDSGPLVNAIKG
jgi:ketosteroid isomerase-like protein